MKKLLLSLGAIAITLTLLAGGIFAYQYLTFTGTEKAEQTNNNSSEMLQIIKKVAGERDVTKSELAQALEQANNLVSENENLQERVKELEDMNPPGLAKLNKKLRDENEQLKNNNAQLTTDLNAKQKEIDNLNAQLNEANNGKQSDKDEIARLEAELIKANETMAAVNAQSNADVEEARTYK